MPPSTELSAYIVYVGFDEIGDKPEKKAPSPKATNRTAKKPAPRQQ
jgi:hypothetical protein